MSEDKDITVGSATVPQGVDDAVGVPKAGWYVAIVNNRSEKDVARRLTSIGVENYLPVLEEIHLWANGRKARVERVMIPSKIFIRCTERRRRELVNLPYIFRFMTNRSGIRSEAGIRPIAVVPDHEITQLKFMLGVPGVEVAFTTDFVKGRMVEVVRGPFRGLVGEILEDAAGGTNRLHINIGFLGSASVAIDPRDVRQL